MKVRRICALYFSATGNTKKVVSWLAETLAEELRVPAEYVSFTLPAERARDRSFAEGDLVVVGMPTYAGKLPNKILPDIQARLRGNGAMAVGVVTFGNRAYDHSLAELCAVLAGNGFHTVAAGAFVGQHAFVNTLAAGRPDETDRETVRTFAAQIAEKVRGRSEACGPVAVPGDASAPYYVPKGTDGEPAKFLKAKPVTDLGRCTRCGACARRCPMGAIDPENVWEVPGVCIKCHACVRVCTKGAKYFDDPAFLSHVTMLKQTFSGPKQNEMFL